MKNPTFDNCYVIVNKNYRRMLNNIFTSEKEANKAIKKYNKYNSPNKELITITLEGYIDIVTDIN